MPLAGLFQKHYKHAVQCSAESLGEWSVTWGFSEGGLTRLTTRYCLSVCSLLKGAFCVNTAVSGSCLQPALWQTNQFDLPLDQGQGCNSAIDYFLWFLVAGQGLGVWLCLWFWNSPCVKPCRCSWQESLSQMSKPCPANLSKTSTFSFKPFSFKLRQTLAVICWSCITPITGPYWSLVLYSVWVTSVDMTRHTQPMLPLSRPHEPEKCPSELDFLTTDFHLDVNSTVVCSKWNQLPSIDQGNVAWPGAAT